MPTNISHIPTSTSTFRLPVSSFLLPAPTSSNRHSTPRRPIPSLHMSTSSFCIPTSTLHLPTPSLQGSTVSSYQQLSTPKYHASSFCLPSCDLRLPRPDSSFRPPTPTGSTRPQASPLQLPLPDSGSSFQPTPCICPLCLRTPTAPTSTTEQPALPADASHLVPAPRRPLAAPA